MTASRADVVATALADLYRDPAGGRTRLLASPMGAMPRLGARLARATFAPGLLLSDGEATLVDAEDRPRGHLPYERVFDVVWGGRRHVVMGATQLDAEGNTNISCIGPHARPKVQLLGVRGAPGNTVHHRTSYWIGRQGPRILVPEVDVVSGVGVRRGAADLHHVVTDLAVFAVVADGQLPAVRLRSVHPGVDLEQVRAATGWALGEVGDVPATRAPSDDERAWLDRLDPDGSVREAMA
ncbi:MAG: CoA-transferase [Alphaproteobacteria bacterium]|nr:CoA-transferase [Alphaproteobacteria bacterium]